MIVTPADVRLLSVVTDALIDGGLVSKDIFNNKKNQQHKNEQERRSTQFLPHVKLNNKSTNKINEQQKDKNDYSNILNSRIDDVSVIVIVVWSEKKVKNPPLLFSPHLFCRKMFFCDNLNIIKYNVIFLSFFSQVDASVKI